MKTLSWDFESEVLERNAPQWEYISCDGQRTRIAAAGPRSKHAARLDVDLPSPASMAMKVNFESRRVTSLSYKVYLPKDAPYGVKTLFYVKDKDGLWFQSLHREPLEPGQWTTHVVDLSAGSTQLRPRGHFHRWNDYLSHKMNLMGIKFISDVPYTGPIYVDDIFGYKARTQEQPLKMLNFHQNATKVNRYGKFEITFELNRNFSNPFDPLEVDVNGVFTTPSEEVMTVPGFYCQDFISARANDGERLTPVGQTTWKIRFSPKEAGTHMFVVHVKTADGDLKITTRSFDAAEFDDPGYVRISKKDPRCFEFDNGQMFYPIGHNLRSPNDDRGALRIYGKHKPFPDRGTYAYEDVLPEMAANGENFAEVWMSSWWLDLEWIPAWKHYQGLGDYNLANAWKLDRVLQLARKNNIRVHLVVDNHGKISNWCDPEWKDCPYNKENGGFLSSPDEFFTNQRAMKLYKQKMRYIIARWGYDTYIAGIELWSELDLTGATGAFHKHPSKTNWHRIMTKYIRSIDPWNHILTTHYSTNYSKIDPKVASLPGIEYIAVDAYRQNNDRRSIGHLLTDTYSFCRQWPKPLFITEYGGTPHAGSKASIESDLHAGLWAGWMLPMGGTPLLWWFDFIERGYSGNLNDPGLFFHFRAFSRYAAGEERRDPDLNVGTITLAGAGAVGARLKAMCLQNTERAYCWIYEEACMQTMQKPQNAREYKNVGVSLYNLKPGKYDIEVWDTYKGEVIQKVQAIRNGNSLKFDLPAFKRDIAVKIKPTR
ncbi:MAG: DUF5060 domain-containing protein [Planctomycetes bacterium]|nr:DUF5060 domain-containing protein [Planctomycetota bacterium]